MTGIEPDAGNAPKLAQLAAQAFEAIHHKLAPHRAAARDEAISMWLEGHEADAVALARQVLGDVLAHPDLPAAAKPVFELMLRPEHQTQAILTVLGVYPIVQGFVSAAVQPFVQDVSNTAWGIHPSAPLSPAEVALAMLRDTLNGIDPYHEAAMSGTDKARLDVMELNTGEPPGIMQLLEAYRRSIIDQPTLQKGVRQSRVRNEWFDTILALRYEAPSPMQALAGAVKGHLDDAQARKLYEEGGGKPDHYDWQYATAGRPPGAEGLLGLLNRGLITEDDFHEAIRQSDIQNRWSDALLAERRYIPPVRSIIPMIRAEAIDDGYARELFKMHGVEDRDIDIYIKEGHSHKAQAVKDLTLANVRQLYLDGLITRDVAHADIVAIGYADELSTQLLELADQQIVQRFRSAAVSHVHTLFVHHRIAQDDASNELDRLNINAKVRDGLINVWNIERKMNIVTLTLAQCQGAWRRHVMSDDEFRTRVIALGHTDDDIPTLKALAFPPSAFHNARSVSDI